MMKVVRTRGGKIFLAVLFGLMSVSLIGFGLPGMNSFGQPNAARVGDFKITALDLEQEFTNVLQNQMRQSGNFVNRTQALEDGVLEDTLARLILRRQMQQAAKDSEIRITDESLATIIRNTEAFQDEDGNFDRERFNFIVYQAGITPEIYAEETKVDLSRGQMSQAVISGVQAPNIMVDLLAAFEARTRDVSFVRVNETTVSMDTEPSDDELATLYEDNLAAFETPERRTVSYMRFGPPDVADRVTVSEEDILAEYNRQIDNFRVGAQRQFDQILIDSLDQADILAGFADSDESFETIVQENLPELNMPVIEVEWAEQDALLPELADVVFAMDVGEISDAIETDLGTFVVRLTGVRDEGIQPLNNVRTGLREQLQRRNAADALFDFSTDIDQALVAGRTLEDIAEEFGLDVRTLPGIGEDGELQGGVEQPTGIDMTLVADEAFYLEIGETSPLLEISNNGYVAVRLDGVTEASTQTLDEAREQLTAIWATTARRRMASEAAATMTDAVANGATWQEAASTTGIELSDEDIFTQTGLSRRNAEENTVVFPALIRTIFDLESVGDADRLRIGNVWYVVRLEGTDSQDVAPATSLLLADNLKESITFDILSQYQLMLDQRYPARINYSVIDYFHNPQDYQNQGHYGGH
ncbi:MAG: peptidyl-prolyl cis-trans isomerase [Pseudomonadota bacterium]